jgi:hypothetical protein
LNPRRTFYALALVTALVVMSVALAACGGGSDRSGESPQTVLDEATLKGIESGDVDLSLDLKAQGPEGGDLDVSLSGPFQGEGEGNLPQFDMTATAKGTVDGDDVDFEGGLVLLPNSAYVNYEGVEYEVDPTSFAFAESIFNPSEAEGGAEGESTGAVACQEELGKLKVAEFVENGVNEGSADVDGTSTTKISGDVDVPSAIEAILEVAESPACRSQLAAAGPLPSKSEIKDAKKEVGTGVKTAHADVYVGDDNIVRRLQLQLKIEPKDGGSGDKAKDGDSGPKRVDVDLELTLSGVNEEQKISAPENAKPLGALYVKLGIDPFELLGLLQGEAGPEGFNSLLERLGLPSSPIG